MKWHKKLGMKLKWRQYTNLAKASKGAEAKL